MHVSLVHVSDEILEQEYRRRYLQDQSTANHSFNKDEYYAHALTYDPRARNDSAASTPTWFTPAIPRMQAAVVAGTTMMAMTTVVHQVAGPVEGSTLPAQVALL